jgi:hypothetical protein
MPKKRKAEKETCQPSICQSHGGNAVYGLGLIGAVVYYIATAAGFWNGVWGVLKALVWPAILVFKLLAMMGA